MAGNALLILKIVTDAKDAAKGIDDTNESVGRFHTGMQKAGAAAAVAGGAVLAFGLDAAKAAAEDAKGQAILATALKNSTGARQSDIASVEDWISKTSLATGVADDELRPALATLARATGDVAKSQDAMRIAMDVSAATGKDLGAVTDALAKGYGGTTTALGRLVPGMDKALLASGDMNKIMAELARTTGGSMATAAETTEGKMQRMKIAMAETKESIGAALLPVLEQLAQVLLKIADWAQNNTTAFLILMGAVGGLAGAIGILSLAMKVHTVVTKIFTRANWELTASMLANPWTWVVVAVVALVAAIVLIATKTKWFQNIWNAAFGFIKDVVQTVFNWIKTNWPLLLAIITGPIGLAVLLIVKNFDTIKAAVMVVFDFLKGFFAPIFNVVKDIAVFAFQLIAINVLLIINGALLVFNFLKAVFMPIFNVIRDVATAAFGVIRDVAVAAFNVVSSALGAVKDAALGVYNWLRSVFSTVFGFLRDVASAALSAVSGPFNTIRSAAESLYNWLKGTFNSIWATIKSAAEPVLNALLGPINGIVTAFNAVVSAVKSVIDWISKIKIPNLGGIISSLNPFSKSAPGAPAPTAVPGVFAMPAVNPRASAAGNGGNGGPTIIIQGAIDPVSTARQIRQILRDDTRRRGGVVVGGVA